MKLTLKQLTRLLEDYKDLDEACTAARKAGCLSQEGRLQTTIWSTLETVISFFDPDGLIMWHVCENEYGNRGYSAGCEEMRPIKTPEDLLWAMYYQPEELEKEH
jgi:hypothetical protein